MLVEIHVAILKHFRFLLKSGELWYLIILFRLHGSTLLCKQRSLVLQVLILSRLCRFTCLCVFCLHLLCCVLLIALIVIWLSIKGAAEGTIYLWGAAIRTCGALGKVSTPAVSSYPCECSPSNISSWNPWYPSCLYGPWYRTGGWCALGISLIFLVLISAVLRTFSADFIRTDRLATLRLWGRRWRARLNALLWLQGDLLSVWLPQGPFLLITVQLLFLIRPTHAPSTLLLLRSTLDWWGVSCFRRDPKFFRLVLNLGAQILTWRRTHYK